MCARGVNERGVKAEKYRAKIYLCQWPGPHSTWNSWEKIFMMKMKSEFSVNIENREFFSFWYLMWLRWVRWFLSTSSFHQRERKVTINLEIERRHRMFTPFYYQLMMLIFDDLWTVVDWWTRMSWVFGTFLSFQSTKFPQFFPMREFQL